MSAIIETMQLSKKFGSAEAVQELTFQVPEGSIFAYLGPNGAGKTTTISEPLSVESLKKGNIAEPAHVLRFLAMIAKRAAVLMCVSWFSLSALAADAPDFTVKKIGEGVYAAISPDRSQAGSNAGFVVGSTGVLVVDTFVDVAPAKALLAEIRTRTNLPIRFVVNTHYHLDHTGGNAVFAEAGATILAHRNVRSWLRSENMKFFPEAKPEQNARVESLVLPDEVYTDAVDIYLGARLLEVRYMLGHTGGDSVIVVPDANVVFGGDLIWQKHFPNLIDANTADWVKTLEKLQADHSTATFVSGHGDLATSEDLRNFHDYLVTLRDEIAKAQAQGKSGQELSDLVSAQIKERYSEWGFQQFIPRNIQQTAAELKGEKKIPVAPLPSAGQEFSPGLH